MVSEVGLTLVACTLLIAGAVEVPPQVKTVIEYGGRLIVELGLKLVTVVEVVATTFDASLLSVMFADVSCCSTTVPVGAFPAKFTEFA